MRMSRAVAVLVSLLALVSAASAQIAPWDKTLEQAAFTKEGIVRLQGQRYEYECLGLGGTVLRVGPYGLTRPGSDWVGPNAYLLHQPYMTYQYWWDEEAHRHVPFDLVGGYGPKLLPGTITSFRHNLDIRTGVLNIDLELRGDGLVTPGKSVLKSHRETFVTPDGVLVLRVTDSADAALPFQMRVDANQKVRIYLNMGVYAGEHAPWTRETKEQTRGLLISATRPKSCVATLGVATDCESPVLVAKDATLGAAKPGQTVTFYIAPGSSYESKDAAEAAWRKADQARARGYDAVRKETADWWAAYYARSSVSIPDRDLAVWYARSLYYHGVFFGNTDVPPGCNGTSVESFAGAVCPEYDLVLSQMAMLYSNHFDEARRVTDWLGRVLPRAEHYATEGFSLHKASAKYSGGAKFINLMGYDGTFLTPPTEGEGIGAYANFPGINAALMALSYVDWSGDISREELAKRILKETTQVAVESLEWRDDFKGYVDKKMPATVQQAAAAYGIRESLRRGVAEPAWKELDGKVYVPTADLNGQKALIVGPGGTAAPDTGDVTWMVGAWWYGTLSPTDPLVRASYDMIRGSKTGNYVFNNGWMSVQASKLRDGDEAHRWVRRLLQSDVTLFDDTCFSEIVADFEDFKKTPEIGAHGALLCAIDQMMLDPDSDDALTIFPALPAKWRKTGASFTKLAAKGGISVSGSFAPDRVEASVENAGRSPVARTVRVRMPDGVTALQSPPEGARVEGEWATIPNVTVAPGKTVKLVLTPAPAK